jgi:hypothetical protein
MVALVLDQADVVVTEVLGLAAPGDDVTGVAGVAGGIGGLA